MVFSYLKTSRSGFGERIQPLKAMFSRANLGSGRLNFLVKRGEEDGGKQRTSEMRERIKRGLFGEEFYKSGKFSNLRREHEINLDTVKDIETLRWLKRITKGIVLLRIGP